MKKFFSVLLLISYFSFVGISQALASELYYVKNAKKESLLSTVQGNFKTGGYSLSNNDPIYGVNGTTHTVVILQQTGSDLYYFYDSTNDKSLNKTILNTIKSNGYTYNRTRDSSLISSFENTSELLKKSKINQNKVYSFEENTPAQTTTATTKKLTNSGDALKGYIAQVPVGTNIDVYLQTTVNTATAAKGDEITAVLTQNWTYNGKVIAQQGSVLTGTVTKANAAGMAYRNGYVKFNFHTLQDTNGKTYNLKTEEIEFKVDSTGKAKSAVTKAVAGAAIGALVGLAIGAMSNDHHYGKSTAISAGAGAIAGLGSAALEQGMDAEIPVYTQMSVKLTAPLNVVMEY